jgi:acyl carrier protein
VTTEKIVQLIQAVRQSTGRDPLPAIAESDSLVQTLRFDSLDLAELAVRIEAEFGVDVFARGIPETVGDLARRLDAN